MEVLEPCSSDSTINTNNADLKEIGSLQGINVWSQDQSALEVQALKELEILAKASAAKEDGELSDDVDSNDNNAKHLSNSNDTLDITTYLKRQEELKKKREHKRSLEVSEKSKKLADTVSKKFNAKAKNKRKCESLNELENKKAKTVERPVEVVTGTSEIPSNSGSEYFPSDGYNSDSDYEPKQKEQTQKLVKPKRNSSHSRHSQKIIDDGSLKHYNIRLNEYYKRLETEAKILEVTDTDRDKATCSDNVEISSGFKISAKVWDNLYSYQQEGVEWLWGLHQKSTGGLLGDEMGLGKTVQVIAFLYALNFSRNVSRYCRYTGLGASIVVCPTTVIHQWVQHFHEWAPEFRVAVLHQSGSYTGNRTQLIKDIYKAKGILVTSYAAILQHKGALVELDWHYIILDEGHKIRNPGAKVSVAVKQFRTPHRLLLTGSPMQNNLQELWSLFDFISPGMLGSLPVFLEHFATPIMQGGYYNSTPVQEATALSMATALKNMITPYLLRRSKDEVRKDICLPYKSEQVLFCSLTDEQQDLYKGYLMSEHVSMILGRGSKNWFSENHTRANVLVAITRLRKICNHPDLYLEEAESNLNIPEQELPVEERHGYYKRSGKMIVVSALLKIWKRQKHRVLLFTQSRAMITVFQNFLEQLEYKYVKMDGSTSISSRQTLINLFNQDTSYDVFLLTTRVGGLGVNLTGANRVIIYDPDWNPATDTQARERAWRIGQQKQVTIYRLLSAGTIEEKMYQRQVWKQLLSNKVLLDPRTQKLFRSSDLFDLFSLQEQTNNSNPETANIFENSRVSLQERIKENKSKKKGKMSTNKLESVTFSEDKIHQMKMLAQQIAKNIVKPGEDGSEKKKRKFAYELELEAEKERKAQEKAFLKTLTPQELMEYNRKKLLNQEDGAINKIDNLETDVSFTQALDISQKTCKIYHDMKSEKLDTDDAQTKYDSLTKIFCNKNDSNKAGSSSMEGYESSKRHKRKSKHKHKTKSKDNVVVDKSGEMEGEKIDGLLKLEIKKSRKREEEKLTGETQDQYVLEKLFLKKGVHTALQHDTIVQSGQKEQPNRFRIHTDAQEKADRALEALRKSRINSWRW